MQVPAHNLLPMLIATPLIAWRLYSRVRKSIGRQPLSKIRPWITLAFFPLLICLFAYLSLGHSERLYALALGVGAGALMGVFGTGKTLFENTPQGMFYTPNAHLGIGLSLLLAGRVIYRMFEIYAMDPNAPPHAAEFASSPLTLSIFGLLAGYYVAYAVGLVRFRLRAESVPA